MSSYNVKKRNKDGEIRKAQYYVWYLGWKECRGLVGREFTEPIVKDLVMRRKREVLPKLTIEVDQNELRIVQIIKSKFGRTEKLKFPTVPVKDVTYSVQGLPPDADVVANIYLGYNPTTRRAVHVHVYRCDSPSTAAVFVNHINDFLRHPDHQDRLGEIEEQLSSKGEIVPRPTNFINAYDADSVVTLTPSTVHTARDSNLVISDEDSDSGSAQSPNPRNSNYVEENDIIEKEKEFQMDSITKELKQILGNKSKVPILFPPQDYDTIRRIRGNLDLENVQIYEERKSKNEQIVGERGVGSVLTGTEDFFRPPIPNGIYNRGPGSSDSRSDGSSKGRAKAEVERPVELRSRGSLGSDERQSRGSRSSGGDTDIRLVSPRWKTQNQVYSPPGQPTSPHLNPDKRLSAPSAVYRDRRGRSPSPGARQGQHNVNPNPAGVYAVDRRGRANSPSHHDQPRRRSGSRGRYEQVVNPYPVGGPPRQRSMEEGFPRREHNPYGQPDLSASMPTSVLRQYPGKVTKDKRDKKDKKKKNRPNSEPEPDYTLHMATGRKMGALYT